MTMTTEVDFVCVARGSTIDMMTDENNKCAVREKLFLTWPSSGRQVSSGDTIQYCDTVWDDDGDGLTYEQRSTA